MHVKTMHYGSLHPARPVATGERTTAVYGRAMADDAELSPAGRSLADHYGRVLELVARCAQLVERGDHPLLEDVAGELSTEADEMAAAASAMTREPVATAPADVLEDVGGRLGEKAAVVFGSLHPLA